MTFNTLSSSVNIFSSNLENISAQASAEVLFDESEYFPA
jgi:hypothetical protein